MQNIDEEYFEKQLDSLFEDEEELQRSILKQYTYDVDKDIYITPSPNLDDDDDIECLKKLRICRDGFDVYMYVVKVDRGELPLRKERV